ncbi:hypothetical protein GGI42DRAFT_328936 [Trichoderma sp. SZMC 28013]
MAKSNASRQLISTIRQNQQRPKIRRPFRPVISTEIHRDIRPKNRSPAGSPKLLLNNGPVLLGRRAHYRRNRLYRIWRAPWRKKERSNNMDGYGY